MAVLRRINPIVRGWAAYYRTVVSSSTFRRLDEYMWKLTYKWARYSHPNKPRSWVTARYFGRFNPSRQDQWVFGDRASGAYLHRFAWTTIVRHQLVRGTSSPDDPALAAYWAERRRKGPSPLTSRTDLRLLQAQDGRCPLCGEFLLHADHAPQNPHEWEQWLRATRKAIATCRIVTHGKPGTPDKIRLIHTHCQHRHNADHGTSTSAQPVREPLELA